MKTWDVATWNVNSLLARLDRVKAWIAEHQPAVLCLQETKCTDAKFPLAEFEALGYHAVFSGQANGLNGVALLARDEPEDVLLELPGPGGDDHRRFVGARVNGVFVIGVYVPNGKSLGSDDYFYKLDWLSRLQSYLVEQRRPDESLVLMGDFNIAPDERDVPAAWEGGGLHCSKHERSALSYLAKWGLADAQRLLSEEAGLYTWFDYRSTFKEFTAEVGLRIDLVYLTAPMQERLVAVEIDLKERAGEQPSDHAPVLTRFKA